MYRLIGSRLGRPLDESVPLVDARRRLLSYLLAGEFRDDLRCPAPASLGLIPIPPTKEHLKFIRLVVACLRADHAEYYATEADRIERGLRLPRCFYVTSPSGMG